MTHFINIIQHNRAIIIGIVFTIIFLWENIIPQRRFTGLFAHNLINFGYGLMNLIISFSGGYYFSKYLDWMQVNFGGLLTLVSVKWSLISGLMIADILMYWWHRINHIHAFFWRFHSFHHKDEQMNTTTAVRFHIMELLFSFVFRMIFYPLFGISSMTLLIFSTIHFIMIIFHHSNIYIGHKIDRIIRIFITSPEMHRIHHSDKWEETNSNYTSILACWDWVFRSYVHKPKEDIKFGLPENNNFSKY